MTLAKAKVSQAQTRKVRVIVDVHREQARSYRGIGYVRERKVGCEAAFAGKPAPTVDGAHLLLTTQQAER